MTVAQLSREQLESQLAEAQKEIDAQNERLVALTSDVNRLEWELAEAELAEDVYEWIADVRRGILTLEELYERTLT